MLSATIWIAYDIWKTTADVPISENGYIALGVGAALSLSVGCGLMALAVLQTPSRVSYIVERSSLATI